MSALAHVPDIEIRHRHVGSSKLPVKLRTHPRLPHAKTAGKSVGVIPHSATGWQLFQFTNVPAPYHDIGRF